MDKPYKVVQVLAVNTPGPWVENACEIQAPDGTPICEMLSRPEDSGVNYPFAPVADANSRLICAAPDMLDALQEVRRWYNNQKNLTSAPWIYSVDKVLRKVYGGE